MVVLSKKELIGRINEGGIIKGYKELDKQLTANGIDLRICGIIEIEKAGTVRINKKDNSLPVFGNAWIMRGKEDLLKNISVRNIQSLEEGRSVRLERGKVYLSISCEEILCSKDIMFKIKPKTTLFRYAQIMLETGFGEAGYRGNLTIMMFSPYETEIDIGARFIQVVFYKLSSHSNYEEQKEFHYQGGRII